MTDNRSNAEKVADLPKEEQDKIFAGFTEADWEALVYDAAFWLRPKQKIAEGDWFITAIVAGRGFGKLLDISTSISTPSGWKTIGDIKDGDAIFDENGEPCNVTQAHPIQFPKKAYRLTFSDGSTVDCGEEHLWTTWTASDRKAYNRRDEYKESGDVSVGLPEDWPTWTKNTRWGRPTGVGPKTRTTQEIVDTFRHGKRGDLNHSIPVTKPLQYPEKDLPIDPYVFGAWIGDGSKRDGVLTSHVDEADWLTTIFSDRGYEISSRYRGQNMDGTLKQCYGLRFPTLRKELKSNGILGDKVIPPVYMQGSEQQRRDFLAGLLDTDGFTDPRTHYIEFCSKRRDHADAVMELARSLGQKPRMYVGRATLNGVDHGEKYRVQWRPTENLFYMPRKAAAFVPMDGQASRNMHRMITNFEEIPVVPMRCLSVDSPNNLFLVGDAMVPTHNTRTASEWVREKAMKYPGCRIAVAGRTAGDIREVMVTGESGILAVHPEHERPIYKAHTKQLIWPNGSQALLLSSEVPDSARGPQFHFAVGDEFAAWKTTLDSSGATLYTNLVMATRLSLPGTTPQILFATTPKRTKVMKDIMDKSLDPKEKIVIVGGSTRENRGLANSYIENIEREFGNSELAKQELLGLMLEDAEGIVFTDDMLTEAKNYGALPKGLLKIIAVDPTVSGDPRRADECGIMVLGATAHYDQFKRKAYIIEDASLRATPDVWAQRVVDMAKLHGVTNIVCEANQGGQLLQMVINTKDPSLKVSLVHAMQGKVKRTEPVIVAMQQKRVQFMGDFPELEQQLIYYDPDNSTYSPDRMDAFVWGCIALLVSPPKDLHFGGMKYNRSSGRKISTAVGTGRSRRINSFARGPR